MITISIHCSGKIKISEDIIKNKLQDVLKKGGINSGNISVAIVSGKKMDELVAKYYKGDPKGKYIHPILTFPYHDENAIGEIVIPRSEAENEQNLLKLLEHGALHLLGIHHD